MIKDLDFYNYERIKLEQNEKLLLKRKHAFVFRILFFRSAFVELFVLMANALMGNRIDGISSLIDNDYYLAVVVASYTIVNVAIIIYSKTKLVPFECNREYVHENQDRIVLLQLFLWLCVINGMSYVLSAFFMKGTGLIREVYTSGGNESSLLLCVYLCIVAPVTEEYIFRKIVLNRFMDYGVRDCVFITSLLFALSHNNLFQLPFTFLSSIVFSYCSIYFGTIGYSIALHMTFNTIGVVWSLIGNIVDKQINSERYFFTAMIIVSIFILLLLKGKKNDLTSFMRDNGKRNVRVELLKRELLMIPSMYLCLAYSITNIIVFILK